MHIWVDADACPKVIKDILFRAATRTGIPLTLIANQTLFVPPSPLIRSVQVPAGFDVADNEIVKRLSAGDLVITSDLPLAAEIIEKGGHVLSHRGEWYSAANIRPLLNMRDFMDNLREAKADPGPTARGAQPTWRALYPGEREGAAEHARFHGQSACQRRPDRRTAADEPGRPAGICRASGPFSDWVEMSSCNSCRTA